MVRVRYVAITSSFICRIIRRCRVKDIAHKTEAIIDDLWVFFSSIRPQPLFSFPCLLRFPLVINLIERTALLWLSTFAVRAFKHSPIYLVSETVDWIEPPEKANRPVHQQLLQFPLTAPTAPRFVSPFASTPLISMYVVREARICMVN
jgi:hypothetical protein